MDTRKLSGFLYVLGGAASYGILASIVKYANGLGMHTSILTFLQFFIGFIFLSLLNVLLRKRARSRTTQVSRLKLLFWGLSLGATTTLYYLSIRYIPVSVGIILLMQSIWMSIVLEAVISRKLPAPVKIAGMLVCLTGTLLATGAFNEHVSLDWRGLLLGLGAGVSYTVSMYASSAVEKQYPSYTRSMYLVMGGLLFITLFWNTHIMENMSWSAIGWGSVLAIFGTILPPLFFTKGIPQTGIGMGSIISSVEIPVSVLAASIILQEKIAMLQWGGVIIILVSVILVNLKPGKIH